MKKAKKIIRIIKVFGIRGTVDLMIYLCESRLFSEDKIKKVHIKKFSRNIFIRTHTSDFGLLRDFFWEDLGSGKQLLYDIDYSMTRGDIIDAGANIGLFTILISNKYPEARIFSIEAEKNNFDLLKRNTEGLKNVVCINAGIYTHDASLEVTTTELSQGTVGFVVKECEKAEEQIKGISIDSLVSTYAIERIGILKMDIEGAEYQIFTTDSYKKWIDILDTMLIEVHDFYYPGLSKIIEGIMRENGYDVSRHSEELVFVKASDRSAGTG